MFVILYAKYSTVLFMCQEIVSSSVLSQREAYWAVWSPRGKYLEFNHEEFHCAVFVTKLGRVCLCAADLRESKSWVELETKARRPSVCQSYLLPSVVLRLGPSFKDVVVATKIQPEPEISMR